MVQHKPDHSNWAQPRLKLMKSSSNFAVKTKRLPTAGTEGQMQTTPTFIRMHLRSILKKAVLATGEYPGAAGGCRTGAFSAPAVNMQDLNPGVQKPNPRILRVRLLKAGL